MNYQSIFAQLDAPKLIELLMMALPEKDLGFGAYTSLISSNSLLHEIVPSNTFCNNSTRLALRNILLDHACRTDGKTHSMISLKENKYTKMLQNWLLLSVGVFTTLSYQNSAKSPVLLGRGWIAHDAKRHDIDNSK